MLMRRRRRRRRRRRHLLCSPLKEAHPWEDSGVGFSRTSLPVSRGHLSIFLFQTVDNQQIPGNLFGILRHLKVPLKRG